MEVAFGLSKEGNMSTLSSLNSVNSNVYSNYKSNSVKKIIEENPSILSAKEEEDTAAVYEKGEEAKADTGVKKIYQKNEALVAQLKADSDARVQQMQDIVTKLISGQGEAFGAANDIWSLFANGDFSNVSEAAKAQAQEDIAEGGYYSVEETSARIVDFAKALTGGDPSKIDSMLDAFKKGYDEATKAWGKDLPEISSKTYDAVMKGFEDWRNETATAE